MDLFVIIGLGYIERTVYPRNLVRLLLFVAYSFESYYCPLKFFEQLKN